MNGLALSNIPRDIAKPSLKIRHYVDIILPSPLLLRGKFYSLSVDKHTHTHLVNVVIEWPLIIIPGTIGIILTYSLVNSELISAFSPRSH